jgi:ssDNA-binding Zn-finger/Zn-ribbon topoisomerase 1
MDAGATVDYLADVVTPSLRPRFRGSIIDYVSQVDLVGQYTVKDRVDLSLLRHIIEPLKAFEDPDVRLITIQAAVQCQKSLILDLILLYVIEHRPADFIWYLETDPKAKRYADERLMMLVKHKPEIAAMLQEIDRNDKTKTSISFNRMNFVICGLNLTNTQTLSWQIVVVDEAWAARGNGLIRHAMERTKQYPETKKIILVGQGGWENEDFDKIHKETDQRVLEYACPQCGYFQPFELTKFRGDDHPVEKLRGTYAGLSWDTNEATKPNGRWNFEAVGKTAHHRCYLCDYRIDDTPEMRRKLNDSYRYRATNPNAEKSKVGFQWPSEASMRLPFADIVTTYLRAKVAMDELAYKLPMEEFYQKWRGLTWSEGVLHSYRDVPSETYDVKSEWMEEYRRFLICDVQANFFLPGVFAVSISGETHELYRGKVETFDEIAEVQKQWRVKDQCVFLDCGSKMTEILRECVKRGHVGKVKYGTHRTRTEWCCWTGLKGSWQNGFPRKDETGVVVTYITSKKKDWDVNSGHAGPKLPKAQYIEFSNLHCKDLLRARRDKDPNAPKFLSLPDTLPPDDPWSYRAQMNSEYRKERINGGPIWVKIKETAQNHEWDKGAMLMAVQAHVGIIGSGVREPEATEVEAESKPS